MMKKSFLPFLALVCFLAACSPVTKDKLQTSSGQTLSSSSPAKTIQKVVTETYQYQEEQGGQTKTMTETITYQGQQFLSLDLLIEEPLDQETQAVLAGQDLSAIKGDIIRQLEADSSFAKLKALKGVTTSLDIREDYVFVVRVVMDMQEVDFDQLLQVPGLPENFADFKVLKPQDYLASLVAQGATKVSD